MIPKVLRGQKIGGLLVYLLGPGEANEHRDRHIVAGSPTLLRAQWLEHFDGPEADDAAREVALAVAHEIDIPRKLYGTTVKMRAKPVAAGVGGRGMDVVEPAAKGDTKTQMRDAPVWHCVLALEPGEVLEDDRWAELANEFMDRMGFTGTADGKRAQARWAAVRHGKSGETGEGQEHIHIAASLVREDGSKVSTYDYGPGKARGDWRRAQQVANELEHQFGLRVLLSREQGGGLSGDSRAETERAKRTNAPETEREKMRRLVRAAATAAEGEAEFVAGLRAAGIAIRPRYARGGTDEVTGYSVRFHGDAGEVGPWLSGGKLARDLSLTALREQQWNDSPDTRADALGVWRNRTAGAGRQRAGKAGDDPEMWRQAAAEMGQWRQAMTGVPVTDRAQWAWMAGQAAGVFAAWSQALEGNQPGEFAAAARQLTRSSQVQYASQRFRPRGAGGAGLGGVAQLLLGAAGRVGGSSSRRVGRGDPDVDAGALALAALLALLVLAIAIALEIARAHEARGELTRALAIEQATRHGLEAMRQRWEADLERRQFIWGQDAADLFAAATGRRRSATRTPTMARAEEQLGDQRLDALAQAAEELVPGITTAGAWPVLRGQLAEIERTGRDAIADLATVLASRELDTADDAAAVLGWRLEHFEPAPGDTEPTPPASEAPSRAAAAASGPLTPPADSPPAAGARRRAYYTELPEDQRRLRRVEAVASAAAARHDIVPRAWSDERLGQELRDRRAEVQLLAEDIAARQQEGPHTRTARERNAVLVEQAEKIAAAQQARITADDLAREEGGLAHRKTRLESELEATSRVRAMARKKLQGELDETSEALDETTPKAAKARAAADLAATATGVPQHLWDEVLRDAHPARQKHRLTQAAKQDKRDLGDDTRFLNHLQRNLEHVEHEHTARASLTPEQRAARQRAPRPGRPKPTRGTGTSLPPRPPDRGYGGPNRGNGPGLGR